MPIRLSRLHSGSLPINVNRPHLNFISDIFASLILFFALDAIFFVKAKMSFGGGRLWKNLFIYFYLVFACFAFRRCWEETGGTILRVDSAIRCIGEKREKCMEVERVWQSPKNPRDSCQEHEFKTKWPKVVRLRDWVKGIGNFYIDADIGVRYQYFTLFFDCELVLDFVCIFVNLGILVITW